MHLLSLAQLGCGSRGSTTRHDADARIRRASRLMVFRLSFWHSPVVKGVARTLRSALPIFIEVASLSVPKQHFSYNTIAKLVLLTSKAETGCFVLPISSGCSFNNVHDDGLCP
jgi:hypothetical protein